MKTYKTCVGYVRVSTVDQVAEGVGLDTQRAKLRAWADLQGFRMCQIYEDAGISGASIGKRPGLQKAVEHACNTQSVLLVYSLSRLARSTTDAIQIAGRLEKAQADLASITENLDTTSAAGKMVFRMLAVLAEFERDTVSERTKAAMGFKRNQGERVSRYPPFGWRVARDGRRLIPIGDELRIVGLMRRMRKCGKSLREICATLRRRGVRTKTGGLVWSPSVIRAILRREDRLTGALNAATQVQSRRPESANATRRNQRIRTPATTDRGSRAH